MWPIKEKENIYIAAHIVAKSYTLWQDVGMGRYGSPINISPSVSLMQLHKKVSLGKIPLRERIISYLNASISSSSHVVCPIQSH